MLLKSRKINFFKRWFFIWSRKNEKFSVQEDLSHFCGLCQLVSKSVRLFKNLQLWKSCTKLDLRLAASVSCKSFLWKLSPCLEMWKVVSLWAINLWLPEWKKNGFENLLPLTQNQTLNNSNQDYDTQIDCLKWHTKNWD